MESKDKNKKKIIGTVVKDKMEKTVVVEVVRSFKHSIYHKYVQTKRGTRLTMSLTVAMLVTELL